MPVEPLFAAGSITPHRQMSGSQMPGSDSLGEVFLQLLTKELSNQDPLNPMDGTDFITQLAQLSTLEQMRTMNTTLQAVHEMQQVMQANSLIGRLIRATETDGSVIEGQVMGVSFRDEEVILDVDGLYTIPMGSVSEISGAPAEETLGDQLVDLLFGDAAPTDFEALTRSETGQSNPYETEV